MMMSDGERRAGRAADDCGAHCVTVDIHTHTHTHVAHIQNLASKRSGREKARIGFDRGAFSGVCSGRPRWGSGGPQASRCGL